MIEAATLTTSNVETDKITASLVSAADALFCAFMTWTPALETNSTGAFSGSELTITNDGGGAGSYVTSGDTTWTSSSGDVSIECRFKSSSAGTTTHNIYIIQGVTSVCALSYQVNTAVLYDIVAASNVETGLTGGENYTFGIKLNQAAGTATYSDSEGNSGSLAVDAAYNNATASLFATGGGTQTSEVGVHELNIGNEAFWLAASSGKYCDY